MNKKNYTAVLTKFTRLITSFTVIFIIQLAAFFIFFVVSDVADGDGVIEGYDRAIKELSRSALYIYILISSFLFMVFAGLTKIEIIRKFVVNVRKFELHSTYERVDTSKIADENRRAVADAFVQESMNARTKAVLTLFGISIVLIVNLFIIIFASEITKSDVEATLGLSRLTLEKVDMLESVERAQEKLNTANSAIDVFQSAQRLVEASDSERNITVLIEDLSSGLPLTTQVKILKIYNKASPTLSLSDMEKEAATETKFHQTRIDSLRGRIELLDKELSDLISVQTEAMKSTSLTFSTSVIRFGVSILLLFFIHILVSIYRYNERLANHYNNLVASLILSKGNFDLEKNVRVLGTSSIEFGTQPKMSVDLIASELAKRFNLSKLS